jgi:hypothetical protein
MSDITHLTKEGVISLVKKLKNLQPKQVLYDNYVF